MTVQLVATPPQITVVIPTFNPRPDHLRQSLDGLSAQTLDRRLFEVIIVDDASNDAESIAILDELAERRDYDGVRLRMVRHDQNRWLAAARTTGAQAATTPFVQFLDDDDFLAPDYLEKCLLLLTASPDVAWVYTNVLKFGQRNEFRVASDFQFLRQFFRNDTPYASLFRRDVWLVAGQREIFLNETTRLFEDWDAYIRLISKGHFGTALTDTTFHYRRSETGLAYRSLREYAATIYLTYRMHLWRVALLPRGWRRFRRFLRQGRGDVRAFSPVRLINKRIQRFAGRYLHTHEMPPIFTGPMIRSAVVNPERFVDSLINDAEIASLASMRSGFKFAPDMSFTNDNPFPGIPQSNSMLAGHIWWQMGGAENIYLQWLREAKSAGIDHIDEAVQLSDDKSDVLKGVFAEAVDNQYAFDGFGQTPMQHLRGLWNLICLKRPKIIFISSNSYLYYLTPHVKRMFPDTMIIDILHNEFDGIVDWFTISSDFDQYLDARIVTSDYWKDLLVEKYGVAPKKVVVADNPVDTELYDPNKFDRDEVLEEFGLDPAKKTISFIGRLHHQKGLDVFLALADEMADRRDVQFLIAGDGELRSQVIDAEKRARNVHYMGYFPTVERVLAATDVLVCPSLYEGAPLIGLECAAMNTALIAPDLVGFKEQIADGQFGFTYQASMRVYEDARTIQRLIENDYRSLIEHGTRGRDWALGRHALPVVGDHYRSVLSSLARDLPVFRLTTRGPRNRLTLHIGLPKTGTTTIQRTLLENRERLKEHGILYPLAGLNGPGHMKIASAYVPQHDADHGVFPEPAAFQPVIDEFDAAPDCDRLLISSEGFSIAEQEGLGRLVDEWCGRFDLEIVVSLRRQDQLIESTHSQNYRVRHPTFKPANLLVPNHRDLDFERIITRWANIVGSDRVTVIGYSQGDSSRLFSEFQAAADLTHITFDEVENQNERLHRNAVEFLQHHTTLEFATPGYFAAEQALRSYVPSEPDLPQHRYFFSPAERASVLEWCEPSNARISDEFCDGKLFSQVPPIDLDEPWEPFPGLSLGEIGSIEAELASKGIDPSMYR